MLDLHLSLMLFVLGLFLTLLVLLNKMLFQPLIKFMDDRDDSIAKDLEASKGLSGNTDELNLKAEEVISSAKNEAAEIRQKAINDEKTLSASKVESKQSELEAQYNQFVERLNEDKENLQEALLAQVPQFKDGLQDKFNKL